MSSPFPKAYKYSSTTPKRVHFADSITTTNSSRLPKSPYPENSKLRPSTPIQALKTESRPSPDLDPIARLRQNINYLYRNHPTIRTSNATLASRNANTGTMAQTNQNSGADSGRVNYQPQVPDTSNGPEGYYYIPRHDGDYAPPPPALGFPFGFPPGVPPYPHPQVVPLPVQQPFQPVPVQQPVAYPLMGQPFVAPQPIPQPGAMYPPAVHGLPQAQPLYLQQAPPQGQLIQSNAAMSLDPAFGIGLTASEVAAQTEEYAARSNLDEPQDFQPADPDPSRMYRVRELDGTWVLFSRATIDRGPFRWYITDEGVFYAVRLRD